jgi:hypothetical protein
MAAGVVAGIVQGDVREGHVADSQVEVPGRQLGVGKGLGPDGGPGIEGLGVAAVVGSSSTPVISAASGANPMKVPTPDPGSRTVPPGEAQLLDGGPHGPHVGGVRVMGVDRSPAGRIVLDLAQEAAKMLTAPGIHLTGLIEDLEDALRSPTPPPRQRRLLSLRGPTSLALQRPQHFKGCQVRPDTAPGTRWCQVVLG